MSGHGGKAGMLGGHVGLGGMATAARGAKIEVRLEDSGLQGAYYAGCVISPANADGLVQVQYLQLHETLLKDALLTEWVRPRDADSVRPPPPPPPNGFHETLEAGDTVEVWHEAGWWPAQVVSRTGSTACEVRSEQYVALRRTIPMAKVRPRWRWSGGSWEQTSKAAAEAAAEAVAAKAAETAKTAGAPTSAAAETA